MTVAPETDLVAAAADLLRGRTWVALTGAGVSTDSGIPDYRGPTSIRATPMQFSEFAGSAEAQRRYWARSYLGWRRIGQAQPNDGHHALADLERTGGLIGIVTQNVDGLHQAAGSRDRDRPARRHRHGGLPGLRRRSPRLEMQRRLAELNPDVPPPARLEHAELRPDGDAVVERWSDFVLADCERCGGRLKPDVVFFGESVPRDRVERAYAWSTRPTCSWCSGRRSP